MIKRIILGLVILAAAPAAAQVSTAPASVSGAAASPAAGPGSRGAPVVAPPAVGRGPSLANTPLTISLWDGQAPGALGDTDADKPSVTLFRAPGGGRNGPVVIVAPGGGYATLVANEGRPVVAWLNSIGLNAALLKYRVAPYRDPVELGDAQRAIRILRARAGEFGIDPGRIGMIGFSAGGHLAASAATYGDDGSPTAADPIDRVSSRLNFAILAYPVITMQPPYAHQGSVQALLGPNPTVAALDRMSLERHVTAKNPPTFLYQGSADGLVPVQNSVEFYLALKKAGVPSELQTFTWQGHGGVLNFADPSSGEWTRLLMNWLRLRGVLPSSAAQAAPIAAPPPATSRGG